MDRIIVNDRQSFIALLEILHKDLEDNKEKWENQTLSSFLGAMQGFAEDMQGFYDNHKQKLGEINADDPSWQRFADIMQAARIYEG